MKKYTLISFIFLSLLVFAFTTKVSAQTTSGFTYSAVLRSGMSGPQISALQSALNNAGVSIMTVDGKFGPATRGAVQRFQSLRGLVADGVVGPRTGAALRIGNNPIFIPPTAGPICPNGMTLESNCTLFPTPIIPIIVPPEPCPLTFVNGVIQHICPPFPPVPNPASPVISGVSGPQSLGINQQGTWTVTASSQYGGNLSYSVDWGDQLFAANSDMMAPMFRLPQQSATFTHSYAQAGTYKPVFTVTSENTIRCFTTPCPSNAGTAQASLSVNVMGGGIFQLPTISSLSPTSGSVGTQVLIFGSGLSSASVNFGGYPVPTSYSSDGQLIFTVPSNLNNCTSQMCTMVYIGVIPGTYNVSVSNANGTSNNSKFTVTAR